MKIQGLGSGCQTCKKLHEMTAKAASELGIKDEVEYITGGDGMQMIIELGVMSSPVLVVDGRPVMVGFTPDIEKIKQILTKE